MSPTSWSWREILIKPEGFSVTAIAHCSSPLVEDEIKFMVPFLDSCYSDRENVFSLNSDFNPPQLKVQ